MLFRTGVESIVVVSRTPIASRRSRSAGARIPGGHVGARLDRALHHVSLVELEAEHGAGLGVCVVSEQERVRGQVVVRGVLRFDVRAGDPAADSNHHSLEDPRDVHVEVLLDGIVPIQIVVIQQLLAEPSAGRRVAVVDAVQVDGTEPPVDVIGLDRSRPRARI